MRVFAAAIGLALTSTAAMSQAGGAASTGAPDREQTFRDIGRILQGAERTIAPPSAQSGNTAGSTAGAAPAVAITSQTAPAITTGAELTASGPVTALTGPSPTAGVGATLSPGTAVRVEGIERGFVQVTPLEGPSSGRTLYVPEGAVRTAFLSDYAGARITELMDQVSRLAKTLENNPYVRLKGFRVNVAVPPSLDVEFEMKGGEAGSPATTR
jgi:hypothetical protein